MPLLAQQKRIKPSELVQRLCVSVSDLEKITPLKTSRFLLHSRGRISISSARKFRPTEMDRGYSSLSDSNFYPHGPLARTRKSFRVLAHIHGDPKIAEVLPPLVPYAPATLQGIIAKYEGLRRKARELQPA